MKRERPIIFSGPMVQAILAGRKTQTRRILKPKLQETIDFMDCGTEHDAKIFFVEKADAFEWHSGSGWYVYCGEYPEEGAKFLGQCPYGQPGDWLWVREKFFVKKSRKIVSGKYFRHLCSVHWKLFGHIHLKDEHLIKWRPSIHMPRWASRITLEITSVRVERLQDISEADAKAEGIEVFGGAKAKTHFEYLWKTIYGHNSWEKNPWVWVITFKRVT